MGFWSGLKNVVLGGMGRTPDPNASKLGDRDKITGLIDQGLRSEEV